MPTVPTATINKRYGIIPNAVTGFARRAAWGIWQVVRERGLVKGYWGYTELPEGVDEIPEVKHLSNVVASRFPGREEKNPQLLLKLPDDKTAFHQEQYTYHIDKPEFELVVGVPLMQSGNNLILEDRPFPLNQGDIVWWKGDVYHSGTLNLSSEPRLVAYWRW